MENYHFLKLFIPILYCCFLTLFLFSGQQGVEANSHHRHHHGPRHLYTSRPTKLFVFGDSYSDTGNNRKSEASSWKFPYGITFPGKPTGRFSDGRVLTDYLAKFVGVKSPLPYQWRKVVGGQHFKNGMNFAYGGTGVLNTLVSDPNMTTQIDLFQRLIKQSVFNARDLQSSVALVTVSGNDYSAYIARNGSDQGFPSFITSVVNQLYLDLKRIKNLGVRKIAVTALQPLGCLPRITANSSFQQCNANQNALVNLHNVLLQQAVGKLNNGTKDSSFLILDLYSSFMTVFKNKGDRLGNIRFENPLKPCCTGIRSGYFCGSVDGSGAKKYTICDDPQSTFFWDDVHPTQEGWRAVYSALEATMHQLL